MNTGVNSSPNKPRRQPDAQKELVELRRKVKQLERDNRILAVMNENVEQLRSSYEAEKQLQYLYSELLLKSCPNMLFLFNEQLRLVNCSSACKPLASKGDRRDLANLPFDQVFLPGLDPRWVAQILEQNREALERLTPFAYDDTVCFPGGDSIHVQVAISPIVDEEGACRGTVMSVNDITELTHAKQLAEDAARSKSSFLANMSHEIRTPMNAVKGLSELLALTELNSLQRNYVHNIISSSNSLLGIINDVLDFSKIDANKIEFVEGPYGLADLIAGVCNVVNIRAEDKELLMLIEADPQLPARLMGDEVRIKQVLTNLLSNAVKYTNQGYVLLRLFMERAEGELRLVFEVEDSGVGIRAEELPLLFDAFSRADLRMNRSITGTGLGLAIAKQLAMAMGGDITVTSDYGKGSTFRFWLPQQIVDPTPIAQVERSEQKRLLLLKCADRSTNIRNLLRSLGVACTKVDQPEELEGLDLASFTHCLFEEGCPPDKLQWLRGRMPGCRFAVLKDLRHAMALSDCHDTILYLPLFLTDLADFLSKTGREPECAPVEEAADSELIVRDAALLVVDDNEINLVVSGEMLRSFQAEVVCAESGEEAIQLCRERKFDIIFMDHMMPGMDGVETTLRLRSEPGFNTETPIVALTANVVNDMKSYYLRSGMDDFIGKPIELADLSRVLSAWLSPEKLMEQAPPPSGQEGEQGNTVTPMELLAAMDQFGLYSSDVMRETGGNFEVYINRMEAASQGLGGLVGRLKLEVAEERWEDFGRDCLALRELLHGIGARDCADRARKLALAAQKGNIAYIHEDFFSLMGNMYMLDKKLVVLVPVARGGSLDELPLNVPQFLHGCLDKMGRALHQGSAVEAMVQLEKAAAFSLNMELDMALKAIKSDLERGDFPSAIRHHTQVFRTYGERLNSASS